MTCLKTGIFQPIFCALATRFENMAIFLASPGKDTFERFGGFDAGLNEQVRD
jgi:hypothetical protein